MGTSGVLFLKGGQSLKQGTEMVACIGYRHKWRQRGTRTEDGPGDGCMGVMPERRIPILGARVHSSLAFPWPCHGARSTLLSRVTSHSV
jgi:hypothetical protein